MANVPARHGSVVVVEDDHELGVIMCAVFEMLGAEACNALTSVQELKQDAARALNADLIVLDIHLGEDRPTGIDAWKWLRGMVLVGASHS